MEAASTSHDDRPDLAGPGGEKAQRILDAMRSSVARRGVAGATFDQVAREAGVSRGLLHYYFGTKERLLGEVARRECDLRMTTLEEQLSEASTAEDFIALLRTSLVEMIREDPEFVVLLLELFNLSRRNPEVAAEYSDLVRRSREHTGAVLAAKRAQGVLRFDVDPEAIADVLFALGDGLALRMLAEPERDWAPTIEAGERAVRALLTGG